MYPANSPVRNLNDDIKKDIGFEYNCPYLKEIEICLVKSMVCDKGCKWFNYCQGNWKHCDLYRNKWIQKLSDEERAVFISENTIRIARNINKHLRLKKCNKCGATVHTNVNGEDDYHICYPCILDGDKNEN